MEPNNGNRSYSNYDRSSGGSGSNPNSMSNYNPNDMSGAMSSDYGNSTNNRQHHNYDPRFYADAQDHHDPNIDALLPPLKQIDINQIPPDVLGHLLKTKRIDHLVATTAQRQPPPQQQQHHQQQQQYTQSNYNNSPYSPPHQQQQQHQQHHQQEHHQQQQQRHQQQHHQQSYQGGNPNQSPNPNPLYRQTGSSNTSPATQYPNDWHPGSSSSGSNTSSPASYGNTSRSSPRSNVPSNPSTFSPSAHLSPMAKEFVPRSYKSPQQRQQQPQRQKHQQQQQGWNVGVYDPNTSYDSSQNWNQPQSGPTSNEFELDNADCVLETITDTITRLTMNPADFQRCSNKTVEVLKKYLSDADTLGIVVTLIFEQSISNPNFCYSGAKLCEVLNRNNITVGNQTFKDQLLFRCQEEFQNCLDNIKDPQTEKRALGLTMFLAELYLNFRIEKQGVSQKINILGAAAAELMTVIAKRPPSVDNIKCIFQTLKLAGWDLYHETHEAVKKQMIQLFQQLSLIGMSYKGKLEPRVENFLESIFKLKDNDWNKSESATSEASSSTSTIPNPYKTAEGQDLAAQEESQFYELPDNVEDDDFSLLIDDEPDEVVKAYEEFLASQNS